MFSKSGRDRNGAGCIDCAQEIYDGKKHESEREDGSVSARKSCKA
jgi:hypothetical protein